MLASGLFSSASRQLATAQQLNPRGLTMALPAAQVATVSRKSAGAGITLLPGGDGSAVAAQATGSDAITLGHIMNDARFGEAQWGALQQLWTRESQWNPAARNAHSGACGIPQALPCSKISDMSPAGQISWGLSYISSRYGTPSRAWAHELNFGWY